MISRQAILKTKGDSEKIQQTFLPLVKEQKQRIPGRSRYIYIIDHIIARGRERERESLRSYELGRVVRAAQTKTTP